MFNQCTFVGNLSATPESKYTQSGVQVVNFTICCDSGWGDKKRTEFVKVVAWNKLAKIVQDYLTKGSKVLIQGEMQTRKWQDKDGNNRYTTEIIANQMRMLSPKNSNQEPGEDSRPGVRDVGEDAPF